MTEKALIPPTTPADNKADTAEQQSNTNNDSTAKVKRLEGVTSIDEKVFLECETLAYAGLAAIADQISREAVKNVKPATSSEAAVTKPTPSVRSGATRTPGAFTIILLDDTLISAFQLLSALQLQLALFEKSFAGVAAVEARERPGLSLEVVPGLAISTLTGALEGVLDLLGLFRQDTQYFGRTVSIKETALYLEVARALKQNGWNVLYPRLLSFQADEATQLFQARLTQLFDAVFRARQAAAGRLRPLLRIVSDLEQELIDREREFPTATPERQKVLTQEIQDLKARLVTARKDLDPDLVLFENTDSSWNELQKGLAKPDEKTGQVPIQLLTRAAESIERFKAASSACFLYAKGIVAGGTMRVKRSLWRMLFRGDGLEFNGGAIVSYAMFDGKAQILTSGTHRYMTGFRTFPDDTPVWTGFNSF